MSKNKSKKDLKSLSNEDKKWERDERYNRKKDIPAYCKGRKKNNEKFK